MRQVSKLSAATLVLALAASVAIAQTGQPNPTPAFYPDCTRTNTDGCPAQVFSINSITDRNDIYNNMENGLRNALHRNDDISAAYSSSTGHYTVTVRGTPDDLAVAQKLIADLDRPKRNYRLTYTVTELDGGRQIGTQHYAMIMTSGQETSLNLENKLPINNTYISIGMNFDATLTEMGENAMLKSSVQDSSVAPQKPDATGTQQPIIRQATLKGESLLAPSKPMMLGSVDIPGSTSHLQIEVVMEEVH